MFVVYQQLARTNPVYEDIATRLFDHFMYIVDAIYGGLRATMSHFYTLQKGGQGYMAQEVNQMLFRLGSDLFQNGLDLSTQFYLEDEQRLATHWMTPLPFPVQVVARVDNLDAISGSKLTTEYRYHHGYWNGAEREFQGLGRVDQRDKVAPH